MNWAHHAILQLQAGERATIKPRGSSMKGKVESGDAVVVAPVPYRTCPECEGSGMQQERASCVSCDGHGQTPLLDVDDIVLVRVKGATYLHLISATRGHAAFPQYQISNNRGHVNGWVNLNAVYGVAVIVAGRVVKEVEEETDDSKS